MANESRNSGSDDGEQLVAFMIQQIKDGADKDTITTRLEGMGMDRNQAAQAVSTLYPDIMRAAKAQEFTTDAVLPAAIGGGLAALVGGAVWGAIVIFTGYEVGFVAWGLGFLSGAAVVFFTRGRKGTPLQVLAVGSSAAGIAFGKYVTFYYYMREAILEEYGAEAAANVAILSAGLFEVFVESLPLMLGGFDILWVILAMVTAWRIPKGMGIRPPAHLHV